MALQPVCVPLPPIKEEDHLRTTKEDITLAIIAGFNAPHLPASACTRLLVTHITAKHDLLKQLPDKLRQSLTPIVPVSLVGCKDRAECEDKLDLALTSSDEVQPATVLYTIESDPQLGSHFHAMYVVVVPFLGKARPLRVFCGEKASTKAKRKAAAASAAAASPPPVANAPARRTGASSATTTAERWAALRKTPLERVLAPPKARIKVLWDKPHSVKKKYPYKCDELAPELKPGTAEHEHIELKEGLENDPLSKHAGAMLTSRPNGSSFMILGVSDNNEAMGIQVKAVSEGSKKTPKPNAPQRELLVTSERVPAAVAKFFEGEVERTLEHVFPRPSRTVRIHVMQVLRLLKPQTNLNVTYWIARVELRGDGHPHESYLRVPLQYNPVGRRSTFAQDAAAWLVKRTRSDLSSAESMFIKACTGPGSHVLLHVVGEYGDQALERDVLTWTGRELGDPKLLHRLEWRRRSHSLEEVDGDEGKTDSDSDSDGDEDEDYHNRVLEGLPAEYSDCLVLCVGRGGVHGAVPVLKALWERLKLVVHCVDVIVLVDYEALRANDTVVDTQWLRELDEACTQMHWRLGAVVSGGLPAPPHAFQALRSDSVFLPLRADVRQPDPSTEQLEQAALWIQRHNSGPPPLDLVAAGLILRTRMARAIEARVLAALRDMSEPGVKHVVVARKFTNIGVTTALRCAAFELNSEHLPVCWGMDEERLAAVQQQCKQAVIFVDGVVSKKRTRRLQSRYTQAGVRLVVVSVHELAFGQGPRPHELLFEPALDPDDVEGFCSLLKRTLNATDSDSETRGRRNQALDDAAADARADSPTSRSIAVFLMAATHLRHERPLAAAERVWASLSRDSRKIARTMAFVGAFASTTERFFYCDRIADKVELDNYHILFDLLLTDRANGPRVAMHRLWAQALLSRSDASLHEMLEFEVPTLNKAEVESLAAICASLVDGLRDCGLEEGEEIEIRRDLATERCDNEFSVLMRMLVRSDPSVDSADFDRLATLFLAIFPEGEDVHKLVLLARLFRCRARFLLEQGDPNEQAQITTQRSLQKAEEALTHASSSNDGKLTIIANNNRMFCYFAADEVDKAWLIAKSLVAEQWDDPQRQQIFFRAVERALGASDGEHAAKILEWKQLVLHHSQS